MNVTYRCPQCEGTSRSPIDEQNHSVTCQLCGIRINSPADAVGAEGVERCVVCPSTELFVRKDFSQRLGVGIIVLGFVASSIALAWHHSVLSLAILIGTALLDAVLFLITGNVLSCYRCHSEYRDVPGVDRHPAFSLQVHERHRQQAARLAEAEAHERHSAHSDDSLKRVRPTAT